MGLRRLLSSANPSHAIFIHEETETRERWCFALDHLASKQRSHSHDLSYKISDPNKPHKENLELVITIWEPGAKPYIPKILWIVQQKSVESEVGLSVIWRTQVSSDLNCDPLGGLRCPRVSWFVRFGDTTHGGLWGGTDVLAPLWDHVWSEGLLGCPCYRWETWDSKIQN